ncbi:CAU/MBL1b family subclass B3 metallo-beta-lactamase [Niabella terrae]
MKTFNSVTSCSSTAILRVWIVLLICCGSFFPATAQSVNEPINDSNWVRDYSPFRIVGNMYYVGSYDLAAYLLTGSSGHILVNTGTAASFEMISRHIRELGFKPEDIEVLLTNQAHYDHVGAVADFKKATGAALYVSEGDAAAMRTGGLADYGTGYLGVSFKPAAPDRLLSNGETIRLGELSIKVLAHPGHTQGSSSFIANVNDQHRSYNVLLANIPTIIVDEKFSSITKYPKIREDYEYTLKAMRGLRFDIWVAAHASQFGLHQKHMPGDAYNPKVFMGRAGYDKQLDRCEENFQKKLQQENQ